MKTSKICGKCEQDKGLYSKGEKVKQHCYFCEKRETNPRDVLPEDFFI